MFLCARVTGTPKEKARPGLINDFAAYTAKTPFQVMVIDSRDIWSGTSDADLRKLALRKAEFKADTECVKSRVLCAVLHNEHYDLGVVRSAGSIRLILAFVKSKVPNRGAPRQELCPRWAPQAPSPSPTSRQRTSTAHASNKVL